MYPLRLRMPVADSYYFIAHDHMDRRGRIDPRVLGIGLAAALLSELWWIGTIEVSDGGIFVVHREPPADPLLHNIAAQLMSQPQHRDLPTWMSYLAVTANVRVADRLKLNRRLKEVEHRRLIGSRKVLEPADRNEAAWQAVRLERLLNTNTSMHQIDGLLAGLVSVTGLMSNVLWDPETNHVGYAYLPTLIERLHPALLAIVKQAEAAAGRAVLAPR
jgi:hypothetical protein